MKVSFAELLGLESAKDSSARQDHEASKARSLRWISPGLSCADDKTDVERALERAGLSWCGQRVVLVPEQSLMGCDPYRHRSRCRRTWRGHRARFALLRPEPHRPATC